MEGTNVKWDKFHLRKADLGLFLQCTIYYTVHLPLYNLAQAPAQGAVAEYTRTQQLTQHGILNRSGCCMPARTAHMHGDVGTHTVCDLESAQC